MLTFEVAPHRTQVLANSYDPQRLFVRARLRLDDAAVEKDLFNNVALYVLVDTSGSMRRKLQHGTSKLERAIEAISSISELSGSSRRTHLGLVHFDTSADVLMPLALLDIEAGAELAATAGQLRNFSGGTRLELALDLIKRELTSSDAEVRKVLILTDGETTDEDECLNLANEFAAEGVGLICIGLGADYNEDFLGELADRTNGFLYHLSEAGDSLTGLRSNIWDVILNAERELVTEVRLGLELEPGVVLNNLQRVYPMVQSVRDSAGGRFHIGNVGSDTEVNLIAELTLPRHSAGLRRVARFDLTYDVLAERITAATQTSTLDIEYTANLQAAQTLNEKVVFYVRQARMNELADLAVSQAHRGQMQEAEKNLRLVERLSRKVGNHELRHTLAAAVRELRENRHIAPNTIKAMKVGAKTKTLLAPPTKNQ